MVDVDATVDHELAGFDVAFSARVEERGLSVHINMM
jgi:hypothetical protein